MAIRIRVTSRSLALWKITVRSVAWVMPQGRGVVVGMRNSAGGTTLRGLQTVLARTGSTTHVITVRGRGPLTPWSPIGQRRSLKTRTPTGAASRAWSCASEVPHVSLDSFTQSVDDAVSGFFEPIATWLGEIPSGARTLR